MLSCWHTDGFIHVRGTQGTSLLHLQYFFFSSDMFGPSDDGLHGAEKTQVRVSYRCSATAV